ncbi:Tlg2-vesicle protein [Orbilia brochopaga]|uniref:Golgi apparatus membrane protein TVP38 n=1 Tax=Orbilia brochopaga TaxID=3140254 RepID=A0AAV9UNZ0_9PEZI
MASYPRPPVSSHQEDNQQYPYAGHNTWEPAPPVDNSYQGPTLDPYHQPSNSQPFHHQPPDAQSDSSSCKDALVVKPVYEKTDYKKFIKEKKYWPWWGLLIVISVLAVLLTVYHKQIVNWLQPVSNKIRSLSWGWIIPILILVALSFPPLFGHEIVIVLTGAVYGLWIGFGIVSAGTFIGEILTFFAFKTVLRKRAEALEHKNLEYAALARITREGGFWIVFIVRLSIIPGHFSTAIFSVCGVNFWLYALASLLTLPKQLIIIYLGVILASDNGSRLVSDIVLGVTFLITVIAGVYIWWKLRAVRRILITEAATSMRKGDCQDAASAVRDRGHSMETIDMNRQSEEIPLHHKTSLDHTTHNDRQRYGGYQVV